MAVVQKFTFSKPSANWSSADEALADVVAALGDLGYISANWSSGVTRELVNSTTMTETRNWSDEDYAEYRSSRVPGSDERKAKIAAYKAAGITHTEHENDVLTFDTDY
tara:strand:+ start:1700 stop:2023 length:324 start_codon:yes stop_codon:yes gene_type:complete